MALGLTALRPLPRGRRVRADAYACLEALSKLHGCGAVSVQQAGRDEERNVSAVLAAQLCSRAVTGRT